MFLFAFTTGMRPSECMALMWPSVRFDRHQIAVEATFVDGELKNTTKTLSGLRNIDIRAGAYVALMAQ